MIHHWYDRVGGQTAEISYAHDIPGVHLAKKPQLGPLLALHGLGRLPFSV